MKGAIADNINNRTNKQSNKLSSPAKKNKQLFTDATNRHGHCKVRRHEFINKVVRKAINFWCTNITITITTTIMSIFCWKGNWRESWQGQTTSGKPQHDLSFQNSSPLHSSLKKLQQLYNNTFSTFFSSRFMESRRARSFMTQLYPPFLALTSKSGVFSFFEIYCWLERKDGSRYITVATIDPIVDLKRGDGYCIIGRLINKN